MGYYLRRGTLASSRRILVVGPTWLGDALMAQSLYMALKKTPGTTIDVLTPPAFDQRDSPCGLPFGLTASRPSIVLSRSIVRLNISTFGILTK